MNLTPENALSVQHQEWLQHPVTKQLLSVMEKHKQHLVTTLVAEVASSELPDAWFRQQSANIKTLDTVKSYITKTDKFIEQLNK